MRIGEYIKSRQKPAVITVQSRRKPAQTARNHRAPGGIQCPECAAPMDVVDTDNREQLIRRRRQCIKCSCRRSTYESLQHPLAGHRLLESIRKDIEAITAKLARLMDRAALQDEEVLDTE